MIAYASVYGKTANAADILACRLRELGIKTIMYDVSVTPASDIIAAASSGATRVRLDDLQCGRFCDDGGIDK